MNLSSTWQSLKQHASDHHKKATQSQHQDGTSKNQSGPLTASSTSSNSLSTHDASHSLAYWKFSQCFGEKEDLPPTHEADIISALEFDENGMFLATADRGGRAVLFERDDSKTSCEYKFFAEFQSHEPEFDYLKSLEIEEKINKIKWLKKSSTAHFLLTTNDNTIKLWRVADKAIYDVVDNNKITSKTNLVSRKKASPSESLHTPDDFKLPKLSLQTRSSTSQLKRVFANAHAYHIHSLSVSTDGESFISADDLRINLWNLHDASTSFNIVDIKPKNMEDLDEVITCCSYSPKHPSHFMYTTSKGCINICDMRKSALCDAPATVLLDKSSQEPKSFFSEILASISDAKFCHDATYIVARDFLTMKLWDVRQADKPVQVIPVFDNLKPSLTTLYENDYIFDKFECSFNGTGSQLMTGSYNNYLHLYDVLTGDRSVSLLADKSIFLQKKPAVDYSCVSKPLSKPLTSSLTSSTSKLGILRKKTKEPTLPTLDPTTSLAAGQLNGNTTSQTAHLVNPANLVPTKKILHAAWHPRENTMAIAAQNNLFIFYESNTPKN